MGKGGGGGGSTAADGGIADCCSPVFELSPVVIMHAKSPEQKAA